MFEHPAPILLTSNSVLHFDSFKNSDKPKPIILILHGLFGGLSNFTPVIEELKPNFRILMPSLPLFSKENHQSIPELALFITKYLSDLAISTPVHIIGNSLGGQIALYLAINQPHIVESLILSGSAGLQENTFGLSRPRRFCKQYVIDRTNEVFYTYKLEPKAIDEITAILSNPVSCSRLLKIARDSKKQQFADELDKVNVPTLLIWGLNDIITPIDIAKEFDYKIDKTTLKLISDCGHAPMMEHPHLFATYTNDFLLNLENKKKDSHLYGKVHNSF